MPSMYAAGCYDLAGFTVGGVEKDQILPKTADIQVGDVILGLSSSGVHSNGFSLVRKVISKLGLKYSDSCPYKSGTTIGKYY